MGKKQKSNIDLSTFYDGRLKICKKRMSKLIGISLKNEIKYIKCCTKKNCNLIKFFYK